MSTDVTVETGDWQALRHECERVRVMVFVAEQKFAREQEFDAFDLQSLHAVARDSRHMVLGCGRLMPDGHIGRIAVLKPFRARGVGRAVLRALIDAARSQGRTEVFLNAQLHARGFYEQEGFVAEGEIFLDGHVEHILMRKSLS